ncbi:DUF2157 domain-containing protein [Nostoc sp. CCY0012]|uniref:DUF2157 domain-containing protein n=1 Tax=Nostoc sp. CCY0012 TaxID=1056123 RepID=UPI0039C6C195
MIFDNFRRQLRKEAQLWQDEGLIDNNLYQQLAQKYQFNSLETAARDRFVFILIAVGAILLGLGVITFVAANWQAWSREVKVTLLLSIFLGTNIAGFTLWNSSSNLPSRDRKRRQRVLGEGLLLLGALSIGANMALLAQMFHIGGSSYQLYLGWGLAVLFMAYGLRLTSLSILALILFLMGYWVGIFDWNISRNEWSWGRLIIEHMPLVITGLFVPLAYWCRSLGIFRVTAIAFVIAWQFHLRSLQVLTYINVSPWFAIAAFVLPPALLWSYNDRFFRPINSLKFQPFAQALGLVFLSVMFYILSFRWVWEARTVASANDLINTLLSNWLPLIDVAIFTLIALWQWWELLRPNNRDCAERSTRGDRQQTDIKTIVIGGLLIVTASTIFVHQALNPIPVLAIFAFNVLLAVFACGLIRDGLELGQRRAFWGGIVLLALQIISRMLEYETALLFKSLVFLVCGAAVIIAGLWFERYLSSLPDASSETHHS